MQTLKFDYPEGLPTLANQSREGFEREAKLAIGPNAAGKSNVLDAVQALSRIGTLRTLSDVLAEPIRGYPIESFSFPSSGLQALLSSNRPNFSLEADLTSGRDSYRYRVAVEIDPDSGRLSVRDEGDITGPLFSDREIGAALTSGTEDGLFENLLLRGILDE